MCVQSIEQGALLMERVEEVFIYTLTLCVRFIRKSAIQLHSVVSNPRSISLNGRMVLKAEQ